VATDGTWLYRAPDPIYPPEPTDEPRAALLPMTRLAPLPAGGLLQDERKLADIDGDDVVVHRRPLLRRTFEAEAIEAKVDLVRLTMGTDARFIRCAIDTGARAIVIEAFGRGNANHEVIAGIRDAVAADVPVIVTTRCPAGRVKPIYGDGGGRDVESAGAIFAGDLQGVKARVLLSVLLRACDRADLATAVRRFGG